MVGRSRDEDPRDASVAALMKRYGIDVDQALRVERTALHLFDQVATAWQLGPDERLMLGWAARLHEVGLVIAHSQYHVHGPYVLENSDLARFSRQEPPYLGPPVRTHRRKTPAHPLDTPPPPPPAPP